AKDPDGRYLKDVKQLLDTSGLFQSVVDVRRGGPWTLERAFKMADLLFAREDSLNVLALPKGAWKSPPPTGPRVFAVDSLGQEVDQNSPDVFEYWIIAHDQQRPLFWQWPATGASTTVTSSTPIATTTTTT